MWELFIGCALKALCRSYLFTQNVIAEVFDQIRVYSCESVSSTQYVRLLTFTVIDMYGY